MKGNGLQIPNKKPLDFRIYGSKIMDQNMFLIKTAHKIGVKKDSLNFN